MSAITEYKCPCCGGAIEWNSGGQNMKCPYCGTEFDIDALKEFNEEETDAGDKLDWDMDVREWTRDERTGMRVYSCKSCGGQIIAEETTAASACPYCGNPVIMTGQLEGGLRPDMIIPFKVDKDAAMVALEKHLKGKPLLPKSFRSENRVNEIKGVYIPFWLFDCDADAHIRYRATKVRSWRSGDYRYTETSHFLVVRDGEAVFEKVPADGAKKMPDELSEAIEPYDYSGCTDFNTAYLAGYMADKYDVEASQCENRTNERVRRSMEEELRKTVIGYASVVPEQTNIRLRSGKIRYALLPVWMLNTEYRGKTYTFAMNGQTGKFIGDLPTDRGRFWAFFAGIFAAVTAIVFGIQFLF